jgi:hypothetical protein
MSHAKAGPRELALRAQRDEKAGALLKLYAADIARARAAAIKKLIPYAGAAPIVLGGKVSPNRPKQKRK